MSDFEDKVFIDNNSLYTFRIHIDQHQCARGQIPRLSDGMGTDKAEDKMTLCGYATE